MATLSVTTINNCTAMANGVTAVAGQGAQVQLIVGGTWVNGDLYTISLLDSSTGIVTQIGAGFATGAQAIYVTTFDNKVYALSGPTVYCSAQNLPTVWNDPNGIGNGFVTLSDFWNIQENLQSAVPFQGRMAFFSRYSIQTFVVDPLIANWQLTQTLTNIGTMAPNSVAGLGDFDVLFLNDSGVRSLRVLTTTLQGFIEDIGSSIDSLVQADITTSGLATVADSISVVDPLTRRYWLFIPNTSNANGVGNIYIFSYYPSSKISAWSTYDPSYQLDGVTTYFTPQFFGVYLGQVWVRDNANNVFQYGGSNNNTYDATKATVAIPFYDMKTPGNKKKFLGVDVDVSSVSAAWVLSMSTDWIDATYITEASPTKATYDTGFIGAQLEGTHCSVQLTTTDASEATLASINLYYNLGESPV